VHTGFWCETLRERDSLEDLGVNGKIKLKRFLKDIRGGSGLDSSCLGQEQLAGCCEGGNETSSCSVKYGKFLD
jgi:hypothetical protein